MMLELHSATLAPVLGALDFTQLLLAGVAVIFGVVLLVFLGIFASVASLWFRAFMSGAGIGPLQMVVMKLKKVNPQLIVDTRIMSVQAGLDDITTKNVIVSAGELQGFVDFDNVCYGDPLYMLGLTMVAILLLHIAGALKHKFIDKDETLKRML